METPDWLEPTVEQSPISSIALAQLQELQELQARALESRLALRNIEYTTVFETVLDRTCNGHSLQDILEDDHRNIDLSAFNKWMMGNKERKAQFYEAQEIGTPLIEDEMISIADGKHTPEADTDRCKLMIEARWRALKTRNRKRYGDDKFSPTGSTGPINIIIGSVENPYLKDITTIESQ